MPPLATGRLYAEITASTATLAGLIDGADLTLRVPSCPDWTLRELTIHLGRAHRWAGEMVRRRTEAPIPFQEAPGGKLPDDPGEHASWLRAGAEFLVGTIQAGEDSPVWTQLGPGRADYWARRMAHETAVHRADAQLAFGQRPAIDADVAADGVDEWLTLVAARSAGPDEEKGPRAVLRGGWSLHLHATDPGLDGSGEWTLSAGQDRLEVGRGHRKADTAVRGPASALLLLLTRRIPATGPALEIFGDPGLLDAWLAATPF
jgi:uncharacterized protein (TIGR03083 family)